MRRFAFLLPMAMFVCGCPVTQSQETPVPASHLSESGTGRGYWIYVPSTYSADREWPLVITLHGTHGWDSADAQIREWKALAEQNGIIVVAPELRSVQGILPVVHSLWLEDLQSDETAILAVLDQVSTQYRVDRSAVMITGFSAGGYPLYYTALRHPDKFQMAIARACNSSVELFENVPLTDAARKLPIEIFWGKDDLKAVQDQSWQAFRWLRDHRFYNTERKELQGGHLRRPEIAYQVWSKRLPPQYLPQP
jgi:poly(3-hydroxybutyrate) depolymerase